MGGGVCIRRLGKTYPGTVALRDVDVDFQAGEVHALLGANGSGKSTLVKLLAGCESPDPGGIITVAGETLEPGSTAASLRAGVRVVHQNLALVDELSVTDNVLLSGGWPSRAGTIKAREAQHEARRALHRLGAELPLDGLVGDLSPVARTIVAVARAVRDDDVSHIRLLVLDEPTATLPQHEVAMLERTVRELAARGTAVVVVSHHLQEVLDLADVVTVLRDGMQVLSAVPAPGLQRGDLISAMLGEELEARAERLTLPEAAAGVAALSCQGLVAPSLAGLSLRVGHGEIVGIAGLEGSGREELLPALFGASQRLGGTVAVAGDALRAGDPRAAMAAGVAYLPADRERFAAIPDLSARENLTLADLGSLRRRGRLDRARERNEAARWFERVDVRPRCATERVLSAFSGGNQQKLMLARWLRREPRVLLLDEPTQGVDVGAQARLHLALVEAADAGAGVLISSSDEEELATVCHRVLALRRGRIAAELSGAELTAHAVSEATAVAEAPGLATA